VVVVFTVIMVALATFLLFSGSNSEHDYDSMQPRDFPIGGTLVSIMQAQQLVSFEILVPTYLPNGMDQLSVKVEPYGKDWLVYLIYLPYSVDPKFSIGDVISRGGVVVIEVPELDADPEAIIDSYVETGARRIQIDGNPGMVYPKQIHWWAEGVHYNIIADLPSEELILTADSMVVWTSAQ
jgi:hypothetical protein